MVWLGVRSDHPSNNFRQTWKTATSGGQNVNLFSIFRQIFKDRETLNFSMELSPNRSRSLALTSEACKGVPIVNFTVRRHPQ